MLHANYRQPGGEENSFEAESQLIESLGFRITRLMVDNEGMTHGPLSALESVFSVKNFLAVFRTISREKPAFVYANNLWPGLSSSPIAAARILGIPVLQAVRNYRLVCPSAKLDNDGACIECGSQIFPFSCIKNGCYNNSSVQSLVTFLSAFINRLIVLRWNRHRYLATSNKTRDLMIRNGIPADRINTRPNFLFNPPTPSFAPGEGAIYVGRLTKEKGILNLLSEWPAHSNSLKLTIVGDGPLREKVLDYCGLNPNLKWIGSQDQEVVSDLVKSSALAIVPSVWAEPFGRVAIEAMSVGTPVVCTVGGTLADIVGDSGIILPSLSAESIMEILEVADSPGRLIELRRKSYERFCKGFTIDASRENLVTQLREVSQC
ncbi:glycosyltransferase family 4 protein [Pseudarthrobacter sp. P1]|uniref:glycosyltransferase family 4 protein n=1 Tax=Pseudarthrobacter sp. P1 TaxID=3418418 RepID=UPI003CEA50AC